MEIYIVQPGDTILSIAEMYGISVERLILDNGLDSTYDLPIGLTLVIAYPKQEYMVQEGDTLSSIAHTYEVSIMQLLRNNPQLSNRDYLYPGETIVISYHTNGSLSTNGYAYPYIKREILVKILPNLTYLSVFNYTVIEGGNVKTYYDDTEVIQITKKYGVKPLLMIASLSNIGQPNIEIAYDILINEEYQRNLMLHLLDIIKAKGYYGINIVFNYIKPVTQSIYMNLVKIMSQYLHQEGYLLFITFNIRFSTLNSETPFEKVDYTSISKFVDDMSFLQLAFINWGPPLPVTNISIIKTFIDYIVSQVSPDKITLGSTTISYDWELPFIQGISSASSLTMDSTLKLTYDVGAIIQFDAFSQTPYFFYNQITFGLPAEHIVWSIDARTIDAQLNIIKEHGLYGYGNWNVMIYYYPMWTMIHSQFDIVKLLSPGEASSFDIPTHS